ncbi:MAG: type II toxin-antitoxin system RelE/ParE family toxin [Vibrio sp.]|uniref:type II toxin-antitoxin system RelE/ParE family toxin n=1 Tax=Vibrio sp. TaxID=678 RepID=UPI003A8BD363
MLELEWSQQARVDLLSIIDYISDDNPDAAQRLKEDIDRKSMKLLEHPHLYRSGRVEGTREMVVRANFIVVYTVVCTKEASVVRILRILHAAQLWPPMAQ